jgi:protein dithiol oxidoreductase (disulfide-forming)
MQAHSPILRGLFTAVLALALTPASTTVAHAATAWTEGRNYFLITPPRIPSVAPGKVEVTEVFSYGCPACNLFVPTMHKLQKSLPPNVVLDYLPASFNPSEDWPMFQLAYLTAQSLGIADQSHDAMFDAVWTTRELSVIDPATQRIREHLPTIEDAARFYNRRSGVPVDKFVSAAKSFAVDVKVRSAEEAIQAYKVDRTPTIIVNGKYRLFPQSAGGNNDDVIELVNWLVAKETK